MSTLNTDTGSYYYTPYGITIRGNKPLTDEHYKKIKEHNYYKINVDTSVSHYQIINFKKIPTCVKCLEHYKIKNEDIPEHVTELITSNHNLNTTILPNTLVKLDIFIPSSKKGDSLFDNLPLSMETLIIRGMYYGLLDYLPINLKFLELRCYFNSPLNHLPTCLEELYIENYTYNHVLNNLPVGLKKITLKIDNNDNKIQLINCPDNVKVMDLSLVDVEKFPEHLEILNLYYYHIKYLINILLPKVPKTLKKLKLDPCMSCDKIKDYIINHFPNTEFSIG